MMRFGFAGVAHPHALAWAGAVQDNGGTVAAVYDPVRERAAAYSAKVGGTVVETLSELAEMTLDGVIVDGRCDEVTGLALQVLEMNLPILIEKPGGMNATDLASIAREAERRGLPTQMGYFLRYADTVAAGKAAIDSGELGQLSLVRCHAAMPHRAWELQGAWFSDPTNITSIFQEDACHVVDILLHLLGQPRALTAMRVRGNFDPSVGEDTIATIWNYGTHLATIDFTAHEANPWIDTWNVEVYGTKGTLRFGLAPEWQERYEAPKGWQASGETRLTGPSDGHARDASSREQYRRGLHGLIAAIKGESSPPVDAKAGLRVFQTVEAIARSADSGRAVELDGTSANG